MPFFASICLKISVLTALSWRWFVIQTTVVPAKLLPPDPVGAVAAPAAPEAAGADEGRAAGGAVAVAAAPQAASRDAPARPSAPVRSWRRLSARWPRWVSRAMTLPPDGCASPPANPL